MKLPPTSPSKVEERFCNNSVNFSAKLKKAQDAITAMRPYAEKLTELLQNLFSTLEGEVGGSFTKQREINKVLVVAITSNRGLCGAFNTNVVKQVKVVADSYVLRARMQMNHELICTIVFLTFSESKFQQFLLLMAQKYNLRLMPLYQI